MTRFFVTSCVINKAFTSRVNEQPAAFAEVCDLILLEKDHMVAVIQI